MDISENRAMMILCREGAFTENQARIARIAPLEPLEPGPLFYSVYIYRRARENRKRED
mgnify:FL=1